MEQDTGDLIAIVGVIAGLAVAYGKAFGVYQASITQAVIDAAQVPSRYRRLLNLVVGVTVATAFTVVGAEWLGQWELVPAALLAGVLASVEAASFHDAKATEDSMPPKSQG